MYVDSCILVKLLVPEPDSAAVERGLRGQALVSSELATTEVTSALLARERAGFLEAGDRRRALEQLEEWIRSQEIVLAPLDTAILLRANRILEQCHPAVPLRTLDALHLATADSCMEFPLCTTDQRMRAAAERLGFAVLPTL